MSMPSSSDAVATSAFRVAGLEPVLGVEPTLLGEASVMSGHELLSNPIAEVACNPLRHATGIDEDERGPMLADQRGQPVVVLLPDLVRHDSVEW